MKAKCPVCGTKFVKNSPKQKFCCDGCRQKNFIKKYKVKTGKTYRDNFRVSKQKKSKKKVRKS